MQVIPWPVSRTFHLGHNISPCALVGQHSEGHKNESFSLSFCLVSFPWTLLAQIRKHSRSDIKFLMGLPFHPHNPTPSWFVRPLPSSRERKKLFGVLSIDTLSWQHAWLCVVSSSTTSTTPRVDADQHRARRKEQQNVAKGGQTGDDEVGLLLYVVNGDGWRGAPRLARERVP